MTGSISAPARWLRALRSPSPPRWLGIWFINALLFLAVSKLVNGFYVHGFWSALWGAFIVSVTNFLLSGLLRAKVVVRPAPPPKPDDVIDI